MESEGASAAKNPIFEMMAKRDRERKLVIEKNQRERQNKSELEGVDYFEAMFDAKVCEIENRLNIMQPSNNAPELQEEFNVIAKDLQDLQKYFTSSTIFLSDHKIKTCQNIINQLVAKCDETKSKLIPKKKFGFKNKSTVKTVPKAENAVDGNSKEKRKEFIWTDSSKSHQIIQFSGDQVNNQDLTLKEMENCIIYLNGYPGSLQMHKIKNCLILCGAVTRSVFADYCQNCTFAFACQQLRLHSSNNCNIYIHVTSRAIIEDCGNINFAPNTYSYDNYLNDLKQSGLDENVNNWEDVGDFNWLSTDKQSPNWNKIKDDEKISDWKEFIENFTKTHNIQ